MATLANAHYVDCDINGSSSGVDSWSRISQPAGLTNGDFSSAGTGWTAIDGALVDFAYNGNEECLIGFGSGIRQSITLTQGETYIVSFDVVEVVTPSTTNRIRLGGDEYASGVSAWPVGTVTQALTPTGADSNLDIIIGTGSLVIDNVSVVSPQSRTIAHPQNYLHLEGQTIEVVEDGVVGDTQVVASGAVTTTGSVVHVGLNYESTLKPSKLDLEQLGWIVIKAITRLYISFYNTLKGKAGTATDEMETVSFDTTLFAGLKEVPVRGGYEREGDVIIKQDEPMPMTVRGIIIDLGGHIK